MAVANVTLSAGSGLLFVEVPELSGFVVGLFLEPEAIVCGRDGGVPSC